MNISIFLGSLLLSDFCNHLQPPPSPFFSPFLIPQTKTVNNAKSNSERFSGFKNSIYKFHIHSSSGRDEKICLKT